MGFTGVAELAHRMENLLDALRHDRVTADAGHVRAALPRGRCARPAVSRRRRRGAEVAADVDARRRRSRPRPARREPAGAGASAVEAGPPRRRATDASARPLGAGVGQGRRGDARSARDPGAPAGRGRWVWCRRVRPSLIQLEREEFDGRLGFRIESRRDATRCSPRRSGARARSTPCRFEEPICRPGRAAWSGTGRSASTSARLDRLMKQVGELVVAKNRLGVLATASDDPRSGRAERPDLAAGVGHAGRGDRIADDAGRRGVRALPAAGARPRARPRQADPVRRRGRGDRARPLDPGRDRRPAAAPDPERRRPRDRVARDAARPAGKPPEGRILLAATRERNSVTLRVTDDGRGIDRAAILAKARREGAGGRGRRICRATTSCCACSRGRGSAPREAVSGVSGRGVGVDVAMTRVRALGGTLEIRSEVGKGTTFLIRVPLTLAIVRALLADAGGERYAVPLAYVAETVEFDPARGHRAPEPRGAGGARAGDPDGAPARPGGQRRAARAGAPADGDPRGRRAPHRARGGRPAGPAGHRGRRRSTPRAACRRTWAGRRSSPTARRRSCSTPPRCCRERDSWKTCGP